MKDHDPQDRTPPAEPSLSPETLSDVAPDSLPASSVGAVECPTPAIAGSAGADDTPDVAASAGSDNVPASEADNVAGSAMGDLVLLTGRLGRLIALCERLMQDNENLREQARELCAERDALQEHNERLRTRIEAMVVRIKGLE
jgi:uncharacterized protein (TIGR02449 family)